LNADIPTLVPKIQKQGGDLSYLCKAADIPPTSTYHGPLLAFESARDAVISELTADETIAKIASLKKKHAWIDDEQVYFELVGNASHLFPDILFICSKVYSQGGVIFNIIYFEGTIYVTMEDATGGEQPLIDVNFPDISLQSIGAVLSMYDNDSPWMKLSIWQLQPNRVCIDTNLSPQNIKREADLSSDCCSCASSTTNQPVTNELMDILDDAMLDICDVLIDCGLDTMTNRGKMKSQTPEESRAFKLSILEKKLAEIKSRTKDEDEQRAWDDKGKLVNIT
jgi:hypothetical protein